MDLVEIRDYEQLAQAMDSARDIITKDYLCNLQKYEIKEVPEELKNLDIAGYTRMYHFRKLVLGENENVLDKLVTVLNSAYTSGATVIGLIKGSGLHTDYYLGIVSKDIEHMEYDETMQGENFKGALQGNFPGIEIDSLINSEIQDLCDDVFTKECVTSVSGIAALRGDGGMEFDKYVQGMEHLADSLQGQEYTILIIADPVNQEELATAKLGYESLYTQLSPYLQTTLNYSESDSYSITQSHTEGLVRTIGESTALTQNYSTSNGWNNSSSKADTHNKGIGVGLQMLKDSIKSLSPSFSFQGGRGNSITETSGSSGNVTNGTGTVKGKQTSEGKQISDTDSQTEGSVVGKTMQFSNENRTVKELLEKIDKGIERLNICEAYGAFHCAAYVISSDTQTNAMAANAYNALMRGNNSSLQASFINGWDTTTENGKKVMEYLKTFSHPQFVQNQDKELVVSPASLENAYEMAVQLCLPKKSISGLPVIECAEFGRNVISVDNRSEGDLRIGKIYHMHHVESENVKLSSKELTAHTFITGSTGAGKSNAIYQILTELGKQSDTTFMVIEPAKGEYKDIFGTNDKVSANVYGTNPRLTPLLRINPFRFPETTHIYEHMDRLVEIFNVCWPMYAAMPAVLKAALENAYIAAGWDLEKSENRTGVAIYPTFASVAREVREYIEHSEYSEENKGNYKGALVTRLESLTNGINGMIFTADDLTDEELFDRNVIVDLSRIGSQETKALIMGVLVMRLQEYRSGTSVKNSKLKHVTVLEEAHNLLKRTSTEQSMEGSNLLGKSVEMLSNSIAEMRTYGEAFIIADQAPGLLDMSVIRNTNTKIILRLPDYSDRELVGKAANLNDEQIEELAKMRTGVAAVYQNNWVSPVLCQFDRYNGDEILYQKKDEHEYTDTAIPEVLNIIMKSDIWKKLDNVDYEKELVHQISISRLPDFLKVQILEYLVAEDNKLKAKQIAKIAYEFFQAEELLNKVVDSKDIQEWQNRIVEELKPSVEEFTEKEVDTLLAMLVHEHYLTYRQYEPVYLKFMEYLGEKRHLL